MEPGIVVLAGIPIEQRALDPLISEFDWFLKKADSLRCLPELNSRHNLVAVLFSPKLLVLSWDEALRSVLEAAPRALPILCHGFAETIDWPRVAEAGAFHSLLLPLSLPEVRQSLGFVRAANGRSTTVQITHQLRSRPAITERAQLRGRRAGSVG
jgi:hypothetical protein